jgi:hypothetical protein
MSKQEYTVKQMAYDLKDIAAEVARAGEQHDCGTLPLCAGGLRGIADKLTRAVEDEGLVCEDKIPVERAKLPDDWTAVFSRGVKWTRGHVEEALKRMVVIKRDESATDEQRRFAEIIEGWIDEIPEGQFKKQLDFTIRYQGNIDATPLSDTVPEFDNPLDAIAKRLNAEGFPRLSAAYFGDDDILCGLPY